MNKEDLIWLAGLTDGEGHLGIYWKKRKGKQEGQYCLIPTFKIRITDKRAVESIDRIYSGNIYFLEMESDKHKNQWNYELHSREDVLALVSGIKSYLRLKREQADLLIEFCKNRKSYTEYTDRELEIYKELKKLNRTGKEALELEKINK